MCLIVRAGLKRYLSEVETMYTGEMDILSLVLYFAMGMLGAFLLKSGISAEAGHYQVKQGGRINWNYLVFFSLFLVFAVFRKVGTNIGGADALGYARDYQTGVMPSRYLYSEQLYGLFVGILNTIFHNYKFHFIIIYGLILLAYLMFFKRYTSPKNTMIPMILLVFPYIKSFNTIRTSLAIAVFLIALSVIENRKILSLLLIISTFFIHRMSILFIPIWFYYWFVKKWASEIKRWKLILLAVALIGGSIILATYMRTYVLALGIMNDTDTWYLSRTLQRSWVNYYPMYAAHLILLAAILFFDKKVDQTDEYQSLKTFCFYDIAVMPASLILGFWRANEYLYIARLIMWGYLLRVPEKWFADNSKWIYRCFIFIIFMAWLYLKIQGEWDDCKLMPYIFDPFNSI